MNYGVKKEPFENFESREPYGINFITNTIPNCKEILDRKIEAIEDLKLEISIIEQDPEKTEEIVKICSIYFTNSNEADICFKWARFNNSCQPTAAFFDINGQLQLRAIGNIKAGKEINFTYLDDFSGFRNRKYCQQCLLDEQVFLCSCDLCKNDVDIDAEASEAFIKETETLNIKRQSAIKFGFPLGA